MNNVGRSNNCQLSIVNCQFPHMRNAAAPFGWAAAVLSGGAGFVVGAFFFVHFVVRFP